MKNVYSSGVKFLAGVLLCLSVCGCDVLYRLLDKEGAEEKELVGEVVPFESNPTVEETQALLSLYGYSPGKVDGVLGLRTRNAIEKFQTDNGLEPSRFIDKQTWEKLGFFKEKGLIVDLKLNVRMLQELLKTAGFNPGKIDGKMGGKTRAAVLDFQKAHHLKVDGKVGYKTMGQLIQFLPDNTQHIESQ